MGGKEFTCLIESAENMLCRIVLLTAAGSTILKTYDSKSESRKRRNAIKEGGEIDPYVGTTRYEAEVLRDKILVNGRSNELQTLETHGGMNLSSTASSWLYTRCCLRSAYRL